MPDYPNQPIRVAKGSKWTKYVKVYTGEQIQLTADAATSAGSLTIKADHPNFASGDKFVFGEHIVVTLDGACAAGVVTLPVADIAGPLKTGDRAERIVADLSGYDLHYAILENPSDAISSALHAGTVSTTDWADDPSGTKADLAVLTAGVADMDFAAGQYSWYMWREDDPDHPIAGGDFEVYDAGTGWG